MENVFFSSEQKCKRHAISSEKIVFKLSLQKLYETKRMFFCRFNKMRAFVKSWVKMKRRKLLCYQQNMQMQVNENIFRNSQLTHSTAHTHFLVTFKTLLIVHLQWIPQPNALMCVKWNRRWFNIVGERERCDKVWDRSVEWMKRWEMCA